jgi:uncharacterized protein YeaO (DUF488 family)
MSIETILAELERLQETIDDQRPVAVTAFAGARALVRKSWPRARTLVFVKVERHGGWMKCVTPLGSYEYFLAEDGFWRGDWNDFHDFKEATEAEMIAAMQSHFDAAWQEMTEATE